MSNDIILRDQLSLGMEVEINPQVDKTRKLRVCGVIEEVLSGASQHPHGILVRLKSGQTGRVKKVLSMPSGELNPSEIPEKAESFNQNNQKLEALISNGETPFVEFKSSSLWSIKLSNEEISQSASNELKKYGKETSKVIIAKTIAGMLNSDGGNLIIGIKENKTKNKDEIIGIESEYKKLKDPCVDGYRRMILENIIKLYFPSNIFNHLNNYIRFKFPTIDNKTLCCIQLLRSDIKVFLRIRGSDTFFARVDATTQQIKGEQIVDYCLKRFD